MCLSQVAGLRPVVWRVELPAVTLERRRLLRNPRHRRAQPVAGGLGACRGSSVDRPLRTPAGLDRDEGLVAARAGELRGRNVQAREVVTDLVEPGAAGRVLDAVADVEVGLFVSNAAMVYVGDFVDQGTGAGLDQITVNCSVPLALVHARSEGRLHDGDRVLVCAAGAGFTWGAAVIDWSCG